VAAISRSRASCVGEGAVVDEVAAAVVLVLDVVVDGVGLAALEIADAVLEASV
jgi:hypothetical protein